MAAKGSKYARKHFVENNDKNKKQSPATQLTCDKKFLDVIYDDTTYLQTFDSLSFEDQLKSYQILKKLAEMPTHSQDEEFIARMSEGKINTINARAGMHIEDHPRYPLSPDEHHLIRMDCYGQIDARRPHLLSKYYQQMQNQRLSKPLPQEAYNLDNSPVWQLFRQFKNFRQIEGRIQSYLSQRRLKPEIIEVMGVQDFSDVIFKAFRQAPRSKKAFFAKSGRNNFVMDFASKKGEEFAAIMDAHKIDKRYTASLLNAMRMFGMTDASRVVVTETHFTERVLHDLAKAKIDIDGFQINDPIPQELTNKLILDDKGRLLIARNQDGTIFNTADMPSFEVHHLVAVSEGSRLPHIAAVNYRNNYLLVESKFHSQVLHGADKLIISDGKEAYQRRMELDDPNVTMMFGFTLQDQVKFDWSNDPEYMAQSKEDQQFLVSYFDVMAELQNKRDKYDDPRNKTLDSEIIADILRHRKKGRR